MRTRSPSVSVVIPTFNRRRYVAEAVESVLSQTFSDYEIVVVDDGSTDGTEKELRRFGDRIRYIRQSNRGCGIARNRGILAARGRWVAFLDSDDVWFPRKLEIQMRDLCAFSSADAHVINALIFREPIGRTVNLFRYTGFSRTHRFSPFFLDRPLIAQLAYGLGWPQNTLIRRDILLQAGLCDPSLCLWGDTGLLFHVARLGKWVINSEPGVRILRRRERHRAISQVCRADRIGTCRELVSIYRTLERAEGLSAPEKRAVSRTLGAALMNLGIEQIRTGQFISEARKNIAESRRHAFSLQKKLACVLPFILGPRLVCAVDAARHVRRRIRRFQRFFRGFF